MPRLDAFNKYSNIFFHGEITKISVLFVAKNPVLSGAVIYMNSNDSGKPEYLFTLIRTLYYLQMKVCILQNLDSAH